MDDAHSSPRLYLQLALVSVIWGGTFIAGRLLAGSMPPLLAASLRFTIASLALLGFHQDRIPGWPARCAWPPRSPKGALFCPLGGLFFLRKGDLRSARGAYAD